MNKEYIESLFINKEIYYRSEHGYNTKIDLNKIIENILIRYKLEVGELEAKVYTYEKIIANSNFAPILKENKKVGKWYRVSEELEQELLWVVNHEEVVSTPLKREEIIEIYKEIERLNKENKELKEDLKEYQQIGIMQFSRPYAKRYLEERKKEIH